MSETFEVVLLFVLWSMTASSQNEIGRLRKQIFQIQGKLDALLAQAGIRYEPDLELSPAVRGAVELGKKIEAIKLLRKETGMGLAEAKEIIEHHMR